MQPLVAILIPVKSRAWMLEHFLHALSRLDYPKNRLHVVFLDDFSQDNTIEVLTAWKLQCLMVPEDRRYAGIDILAGLEDFGNNTSSRDPANRQEFYRHFSDIRQHMLDYARELGVDNVLVLDSDTLVAPDLLTGLLSREKAVCGSLCFTTDGIVSGVNPLQRHRCINAMNRVDGQMEYAHWTGYTGDKCSRVDVTGGVYLLSRSVLDADIPYPETPHRYGEDVGYCQVLAEAGFEIWLDEVPRSIHVMSGRSLTGAVKDYDALWGDGMRVLSQWQDIAIERSRHSTARVPAFSLCIPFASDNEQRQRIFDYVLEYWAARFPQAEVCIGTGTGKVNRSALRNAAAAQATTNYLLFVDADAVATPESVEDAFSLLTQAGMVQFSTVTWVNTDGTARLLSTSPSTPLTLAASECSPPAGDLHGLFFLVSHEAFTLVNGFDEGYEGWGFEDLSFGTAIETLVDPIVRVPHTIYHLDHGSAERSTFSRAYKVSAKRHARYTQAAGDVDAMYALVHEADH